MKRYATRNRLRHDCAMNDRSPLRIVILSEAKDLLSAADCRSLAALGMTKS
jgi:hypothetical protein